MFGGIIDAIGRVRACDAVAGGRTLVIDAGDYWTDLRPGASVAVDGVCLTLTEVREAGASFDVITETLRRTTLGERRAGDRVNLQKSLAAGDRIDGHFVQGHIDGVAVVQRVDRSAREAVWWFQPSPNAVRCIIPKGAVAIDGISLTIAEVRGGSFSVALIPTTLERTTLGDKRPGDRVNVETDILVRTVVHYLQSGNAAGGVTAASLRDAGFA